MAPHVETPILSVVIPTFGRPQYLPRAVESALMYSGKSVEVIVVPNGPDQSWRLALAPWASDIRVRVSPIETAHGNAARNHGMALARGTYLRFLDDDDYLLPAATSQISMLEQSKAEVCSGMVSNIDEDGNENGIVGTPDANDFVCAALSISGFTLPVANLFLRTALDGCHWDESIDRAQDNVWMMDLAKRREWSWAICNDTVGVWFQHRSARTSSTRRLVDRQEAIIGRFLSLHHELRAAKRLSPGRSDAIARGMWYYIHRGFPNHPIYWSKIARLASHISATARPNSQVFHAAPFASVPPLRVEWLLLPARCVSQYIRAFREACGDIEYRRRV